MDLNLEQLKSEISKRTKYGDPSKESEYNQKVEDTFKDFPDEGSYVSVYLTERLNLLEKNKLLEIRKELNDDNGFKILVSQLDNLKNKKNEKVKELDSLVAPRDPRFLQRLYTRTTGNTNNAAKETNDYDTRTKNIQSEISNLGTIIKNIETLKRVYYAEGQNSGGKRKTRRNRKSKKSRKSKSRKNYGKSKRSR
jgi:hypothetical protein